MPPQPKSSPIEMTVRRYEEREDNQLAKVRRMRIHPDFLGMELGSQALKALENRARSLGFTRLYLDTSVLLEKALRYYPSRGYIFTHEEGEGDQRLLYFEKRLR